MKSTIPPTIPGSRYGRLIVLSEAEQNRNRADNRWLTLNGETLCLTDWARRLGISKWALRERLRAGWSVERALTQPPGKP